MPRRVIPPWSRFRFRPLRLGDVVASYNQASVVGVTDVNGLWTWTLAPAAAPYPAWEFAILPPSPMWAIAVRFRDLAHPALAENVALIAGFGAAGTGIVDIGGGYQYPVGTLNLNGGAYNAGALVGPGALARAGVVEVAALGHGGPTVGSAVTGRVRNPGANYGDSAQAAAGVAAQAFAIEAWHPAGAANRIFSARPEYAILDLTEILG